MIRDSKKGINVEFAWCEPGVKTSIISVIARRGVAFSKMACPQGDVSAIT